VSLEAVAQRAWTPRTPADRLLRAALVPAAVAYGAATALRNRLYDGGWLLARRVPARVVSIGNIAVGGTGKTPAALWLAERLAARGWRPAIVARGYRKRRPGVVVVGVDGTPLVAPADGGDEAVMLARRFRGPVVTGERRAEAAALACARFGVDVVVLDDGFQHRGLARDIDLVLLGPEATGSWPLPAGPLRESPDALARARALLAIDGAPRPPVGLPVFGAQLRPTALVVAQDGAWHEEPLAGLAGVEVAAVAGIARPERFVATLEALGARVRTLLRFPDHHEYREADAVRIATAGGLTVTTEKDLVKLVEFASLGALRAVRMALEVERGEALLDLVTDPSVDLERD